ncbi:MAG: hypothetical protein EXS49_02105 [Candidatus Pacebacteria bacterium]|nr:hypothetical protein [Candidatus Paceibacterota bacterium]
MPDNNFNPNSLYPNINNGQKVGAPPVSEIEVRTMQNDIKSVQRGEINPVPESVLPPMQDKAPEFKPETVSSSDKVQLEDLPKKSHTWLYVVIILILALGGSYYFFSGQILGFLGLGTMNKEVVENNNPVPKTEVPVQQIPKSIHQSFFVNAQDITEVKIPSFNYDNFSTLTKQAISTKAQAAATLLEVGIYDEAGSQIAFSSFLPVFFPIDSTQLGTWFNDDFTFFNYSDSKGNWPGFVAKFKNTANLTEASSAIKASLEVQDIKKFYFSDPGKFNAFKDGLFKAVKTRYAPALSGNFSFNYGFFGDYFIVSTSYDGFKAAVTGLGL